MAIFNDIDGWYNPHRLQARLGARSPDKYEAACYANQASSPDPDTPSPDLANARQLPIRDLGEPHRGLLD